LFTLTPLIPRLIDHESFLSFGVALTFFTLGVVGIIGSDDILCCFVVGNSFTWDDWFRVETEDHAFQDVIDQLLNSVRAPASAASSSILVRMAHPYRPSSSTSARSSLGPSLATSMAWTLGVCSSSACWSCPCGVCHGCFSW
jgi:hypothetical protein